MIAGTRFVPLIVLVLALLLPAGAGAAGPTARASGPQDLLAGPGGWNDVVGHIDNQERVSVLQCTQQQRWCLVQPLGSRTTGWVEGSYLIGSAAKNAVSPFQFSYDPFGTNGFFHAPMIGGIR